MTQGICAKTIVNCTKEQVNELSNLLKIHQKKGWSLLSAQLYDNDVICLVFNIKGDLYKAIIPPERKNNPIVSLISKPFDQAGHSFGNTTRQFLETR